jgi:hypothetical protein
MAFDRSTVAVVAAAHYDRDMSAAAGKHVFWVMPDSRQEVRLGLREFTEWLRERLRVEVSPRQVAATLPPLRAAHRSTA